MNVFTITSDQFKHPYIYKYYYCYLFFLIKKKKNVLIKINNVFNQKSQFSG